ncbi:MAG: RCC1 domain-containing protein [Acidimicrobiia bacterium]
MPAPPTPLAPATRYHPLVPARLLDTRFAGTTVDGVGTRGFQLGPGMVIDVPVLGRGGVPSTGVSAVAVNVTVTKPTAGSVLTVWPTGSAMPGASNLNFSVGQTTPNLVVAKIGTGGRISIYNLYGTTDVIVDVAGFFPAADPFVPLVPARVLDTRPGAPTVDGLGVRGSRLGADETLELTVMGRGGVPSTGVDAVVLNVTAANVSEASYLTVWPTGVARPTASSVNMRRGDTVPNLVIAKVGERGSVSVYNYAGATDVVADVQGYFPTGGSFVPLTPSRILETRPGGFVVAGGTNTGRPISPMETFDIPVVGIGGVPTANVSAVVLNVTGISPSIPTYLNVWPTGAPRPGSSNLNVTSPSQISANLVIVKVGAAGFASIYNDSGRVDLVADVVGYFRDEPNTVRSLTAGANGNCSVTRDGRLACWGAMVREWFAPPHTPSATAPPEPRYLPVPLGADGKPLAGYTPVQEPPPPVLSPRAEQTRWVVPVKMTWFDDVVDVALGAMHTCVLRSDRTVWCWGENIPGTLGVTYVSNAMPVQVSGLSGVVDVEAAGYHTCALEASGSVRCWGDGFGRPINSGILSEGTLSIAGWSDIEQIAVGVANACALHSGGTVSCVNAGVNPFGAVGNLDMVTIPGLVDADSISLEWTTVCATQRYGRATCWQMGTPGNPPPYLAFSAEQIVMAGTGQPATDVVQVLGYGSADFFGGYRCVLRVDQRVYCYGSAQSASLGIGSSPGVASTGLSTPIAGLPPVVYIFGGENHMCAAATDGGIYCWGKNDFGQLGNGTFTNSVTPVRIGQSA